MHEHDCMSVVHRVLEIETVRLPTVYMNYGTSILGYGLPATTRVLPMLSRARLAVGEQIPHGHNSVYNCTYSLKK